MKRPSHSNSTCRGYLGRGTAGAVLCLALFAAATGRAADTSGEPSAPKTFDFAAKETLTVAQLNHADTLRFTLRSGEVRTFVLRETSARIVERIEGGLVYSFECRLEADGQPLTLRRYVCSQETFYEPWIVNGVRIWFSSSAAIFKLVPIRYPEEHDPLSADAVLCVQDATLPICPQSMRPWFPLERRFIDVGKCYNGDDPWIGPYLGKACHMGLDINMPTGTPHFAPIDFDDQWIFSADHRWRGVRRWPNGDIWALQSHHVDRLLITERTPLKAGTHYAEAAGKGIGSHQHAHFEFRTGEGVLNRGQLGGTELDPWILFWQIFENDKAAKGELQARMAPLAPATTGRPVRFSAIDNPPGSTAAATSAAPRYRWSFGDGGISLEASPEHTFPAPGVYPVTLIVDNGSDRATRTQHITINGPPSDRPALALDAAHEGTFRRRPPEAADVYGWPVGDVPHMLRFTVVPQGPRTSSKFVDLRNAGQGVLASADSPQISYDGESSDWLEIRQGGAGNHQRLEVAVDPANLAAGRHGADVTVHCPGAVNAVQSFRVEVHVRPSPTADEVIVDDRDAGFFATPGAWVGHQHLHCRKKGYQKRYLTNGGRADSGSLVRFTPDLAAGRYEVLFHSETPLVESSFSVRIRNAAPEKRIRFSTDDKKSLSLGTFLFNEGTDGFVEISAETSTGLVVVDAVVFRRAESE